MARTNISATRIKPEVSQLLTLRVLRSARISPHFARVTLGGGDIDRFRFMGFDQWFRLFIPVDEESLARMPQKLSMIAYAKYLTIAKTSRPVLRTYSVRAFRPDGPDGPELDIDFVLHGSAAAGTAGPAAAWAETCRPGAAVAIIDEGIGFNPDPAIERVLLVAEESGLPGAAGILASLPVTATGQAILEIPDAEDRQDLVAPPGVEITWLPRTDHRAIPGRAALAAAEALPLPLPDELFYGWTVGEQSLPTGVRRHWIRAGVPKDNIMFCGYWRHRH